MPFTYCNKRTRHLISQTVNGTVTQRPLCPQGVYAGGSLALAHALRVCDDCLVAADLFSLSFPSFCSFPPAGLGTPRFGKGDRIPNTSYKLYLRGVYVVWTSTRTSTQRWDMYVSPASTNYRQGKDSERLSILSGVTEQALLFLTQILCLQIPCL